jgi:CubicO group peptidase (beta-lactamase class C family)
MKQLVLIPLVLLMGAQAFAQGMNDRLDALMSSTYPQDKPGAAIAIVKDGKVVFKKGYGIADLDSKAAITSSTNFNICSMTKQFTAYGILKLQDQGKLSLDDKLIKFFPDFNPAVAGAITVRNLLTQSSGIVDHYDHVDKARYTEFWDKDVLAAIKSVDSTYFPVGSKYRYSNTAFCLLSLIIEKVSGKPYPEFVRDNFFGPLRMEHSDVIHHDFDISNRAFGYAWENIGFKIADAGQSLFFSTQGDGGLYTSIDDYLKWIMAVQSGKGLNANLIKEAQSPQFSIDPGRNISYGFGWFVAGSGDDRLIYHPGSNGGFRTIVLIKPSQKYSVVIFSNQDGVDVEDLVRRVNKICQIDDKAFVKTDALIS